MSERLSLFFGPFSDRGDIVPADRMAPKVVSQRSNRGILEHGDNGKIGAERGFDAPVDVQQQKRVPSHIEEIVVQ